MSTNNESFENRPSQIPSRWPAREHMFWYAATLLALVANLILFVSIHQMGTRVAEQKDATASQISKLGDLITQNSEENSQRMASVAQEARESVMTTQEQAKADLRRTNASLAARIADETKTQQQAQQQVAGQLDELKQASSTASSKIEQISGDITGVKGDVSSAQSVLDQHGNELKRVTGDMGVMSGLIATNAHELNQLKELGDRNYIEFDLKKNSAAQKLGGIQLQLAKADPKRNRFTLEVLADDKRVEKRDRTINEPVQLYVAGNRQPVEIVVNDVKKDEVTGYLAVPKVTMARR
jgi:chromosome segregation ATPase